MNNALIKCLLIDDDSEDHEIFSYAISSSFPNAACWSAYSHVEAIEKLYKAEIPVPDFIFLDWTIADLEAKKSLAELHNVYELKNAVIVILSGSMQPQLDDIQQFGVRTILQKQPSISLLSRELEQVIKAA
jgi:DNA-binding NarL/FixJ family response regulator